MGCTFCATGTLGLSGNLLSGEILEQLWHANQHLNHTRNEWRRLKNPTRNECSIDNVVFMGMGEPLENCENLLTTLEMSVKQGLFGISANKITVSTVGVIEGASKIHSFRVEKMGSYTRFELRSSETALVSGGEDVKLHSFRVEKMCTYTRFECI
jgi:adenine C2-methylase RlmN of 23S rRNA A2503 and tRNA A37